MTEKEFTVEEAAELGEKSFTSGHSGIPIHDAAFMSRYFTVMETHIGSRLKYLDAYTKARAKLQREQADADWAAFLLSEEEGTNG